MLGVGRYLNLCIGTFIIAVFVFIYFVNTAPAQVTPPDPKHVFREDSRAYKKEHKQRIKALHKKISPDAKGTYFDAPEVSYDRKSKVVRGKGGVTVSVNGIQIEAEEGTYNMETKKAVFNRNVLVSGFGGDLRASSGRFNFTSETGSFRDADFLIEDGGYRVKARKLRKVSTEKYSLEDAQFSTCDCVDGTFPWSLNSKKVRITKEGYAVAKHLTLKCGGLPLFYTPYFFFPAMTERHSGFLVPEIGYSKKDGIKFSIPYFAALDDNTDLMLTPFIKSNTRRGIGV
ncbi:MAG: LPS-assembly protein LptD, partial [Candidatus Dadabacteria bacterium]